MLNNKKQVIIKLETTINDQGQIETIQTEEKGTLIQRKLRDVLLFDEITDEGGQISNLITLQADRVSIKRSGVISMHQQFTVDQMSETMYEHPHGTLHLETFTKSINYETIREQFSGQLEIDYTVSLNGQEERQHKLVLMYQEED
ncbi:MAG TPA: DUF1934 domain-containing protein [Bacillota bacterium]|nr:DUF1934 domain-containing protein [Bacillota bacterium]